MTDGHGHWRRPLVTLLAVLAVSAAAWAQPRLPVAAVNNVPEVLFGTTVDDPYRDFENLKSPEVAGWMKAHSEHAHRLLRSISGRDSLREKLERYESAAAAQVTDIKRLAGDLYFYQRRSAKDEQFKLVMRQGLQGRETLVFDPELLNKKTGKRQTITFAQPSPDGRLVALGVSASGEAGLRVLETRSGRQIGREVDRVLHDGISWLPDSSGFFFHRLQLLGKGRPATEKHRHGLTVFMKPGGHEASLRTIVRAGQHLGLGADETAVVDVQHDGRVLLRAGNGVAHEQKVWHSTTAAVLAGKADWQPLATSEDRVTALVLQGERYYALTHQGAPRFKLVGGRLGDGGVATAAVLVPEGERVLTGLAVASDALYVATREGSNRPLLKRAHRDDATVQEVPLPLLGAFDLGSSNGRADLPGVWLGLNSWTRALQVYAVAADGRVSNTGLLAMGPYDAPGDVLATDVLVTAADGAEVPMSIVHKAGVVLDGTNPTLLTVYASHGRTEEPTFSISRLAWLEAGGVLAVANPRGSGFFGQQWHDGGKHANKANGWRDFINCAEWLVAQRWTQPARLAIWGAGAGAIVVGMAMNERPELFAAVVAEGGALDMVRAETTPQGAAHIAEFGSRNTEPGFLALLAMSPYHQVQEGAKVPAVLFTHGVNDPQVAVWNSSKTAARLMAASSSGKPVLMRLLHDAGPGVLGTRSQRLDESADLFAFLLWQMGVAGYAPAATVGKP